MENNERNTVSYYDKTYREAKEFRTALQELGKKVDLAVIRSYLLSNYKDPMVSQEIYAEADRLRDLRATAIKREMLHASAQADLAGVKLAKETLEGTDLSIGFKREITDKVPSLGVYNLFMFYTKEELEQLLDQSKTNETSRNSGTDEPR